MRRRRLRRTRPEGARNACCSLGTRRKQIAVSWIHNSLALSYCQAPEFAALLESEFSARLLVMARKNPAAVALGKRGARKRNENLTPEQRSEIARKAGKAGGRGRKKAD